MRAVVLHGPGDVRVEERPVPHAGPGQLVVRMLYAGMCGTDVEAYQHPILPPDMVLGHENVGEIVGQKDVDGALVGGASLDGEQFATLSAIAAGGPLP